MNVLKNVLLMIPFDISSIGIEHAISSSFTRSESTIYEHPSRYRTIFRGKFL